MPHSDWVVRVMCLLRNVAEETSSRVRCCLVGVVLRRGQGMRVTQATTGLGTV